MEQDKISIEELRKHKIFLATPMYGAQCMGSYTKSVAELSMICAVNQIAIKHYFIFNESLIQRARNYCVDEFLRSDSTHLLFIDADVAFNPHHVINMLAIQLKNEEIDIITAPYPKKAIAWEKVIKAVEQGKGNDNPYDLEKYTGDMVFNPVRKENGPPLRLDQPIEIMEGGTGFMLIPRYVFEKFNAAFPELRYTPDHIRSENFDGTRQITAFFDCIIDRTSGRYLSEDYFFSRKCREIGLSIWMCPWMELHHIGTYIFKGNMIAANSIGAAATANESARRSTYNKNKAKRDKKKNS